MPVAIDLQPYDPEWARRYEREVVRIRTALGELVRGLEHVGSTSVPDLIAKPIVDIVLAVADSTDEGAYVPPLEEIGYVFRLREPDWFEHRLLRGPGDTINLHVFTVGSPEIDAMIRFRDRLRAHTGDRRLYADVKKDLASRTWESVQDYADAKSEVVGEILSHIPDAADR